MERESQQMDRFNPINVEAKYVGDIFKVRDKPQDHVGYLPDVLQEKIFSNLTPPDLAQCARVCRAWLQITERSCNMGRLDLSSMGEKLDNDLLGRLTRKRRISLRQINLHGSCGLSFVGFRLLAACSNLQDINLSGCLGLSIGPTCLREICRSLPKVKHWILNHLPWLADTELKALADSCLVVETLELLNCVQRKFTPQARSAGVRVSAETDKPEAVKRSSTTPGTMSRNQLWECKSTARITDAGLSAACQRGLKRFIASSLQYVDGTCFQMCIAPNSDTARRIPNGRPHQIASSIPERLNDLTQFTMTNCARVSYWFGSLLA
ncbi:unnamed protein product [Echinostoma caproni]|uniref:F-box domain-containing protein n=1 Tax=Echinostoma caproni TaxID=27848 RepID=A0A183APV2_9TREM|nr:unnamed protein product [Echinostoma caproni]